MTSDFYGPTIPCLFCNDAVAIEDEGYEGVLIGYRAICTGCLTELKRSFDSV
jgi:hypothetical protein